jgi:hypothetical protein
MEMEMGEADCYHCCHPAALCRWLEREISAVILNGRALSWNVPWRGEPCSPDIVYSSLQEYRGCACPCHRLVILSKTIVAPNHKMALEREDQRLLHQVIRGVGHPP